MHSCLTMLYGVNTAARFWAGSRGSALQSTGCATGQCRLRLGSVTGAFGCTQVLCLEAAEPLPPLPLPLLLPLPPTALLLPLKLKLLPPVELPEFNLAALPLPLLLLLLPRPPAPLPGSTWAAAVPSAATDAAAAARRSCSRVRSSANSSSLFASRREWYCLCTGRETRRAEFEWPKHSRAPPQAATHQDDNADEKYKHPLPEERQGWAAKARRLPAQPGGRDVGPHRAQSIWQSARGV